MCPLFKATTMWCLRCYNRVDGECFWRKRILSEGVKGPVGQLGSWTEIGGGWMDARIESPAHLSAVFRAKVCQHFYLIVDYAG